VCGHFDDLGYHQKHSQEHGIGAQLPVRRRYCPYESESLMFLAIAGLIVVVALVTISFLVYPRYFPTKKGIPRPPSAPQVKKQALDRAQEAISDALSHGIEPSELHRAVDETVTERVLRE